MALQMVHFLAADLWARKHPEYLDSPEFYLGVTGPDAIYIRDGRDKSHKNEIHLNNWGKLDRQAVLDYWSTRRAPFDVGYGVHVLTDAQWVPRFRTLLPELLLEDGQVNQGIYYNDCFVTDFELLRVEPRLGEIMAMLARSEGPADHPLLEKRVFDAYRDNLIKLYGGPCPRSEPVRYVTAAFVRAFVKDCANLIDELYEEVFP